MRPIPSTGTTRHVHPPAALPAAGVSPPSSGRYARVTRAGPVSTGNVPATSQGPIGWPATVDVIPCGATGAAATRESNAADATM